MKAGSAVRAWLFWTLLLAAATLLLIQIRTQIEQSHVALVMLLFVLGGSISGGRTLGISLSLIATAIIDYFFQAPFGNLSVPRALDLDILIAFAATAFVTTELLTRLREEAARAQARTHEVETLARLGAETLRFASANEVIDAITRLVRDEAGADECTIVPLDERLGERMAAPLLASRTSSDMRARLSARCLETGHPAYLGHADALVDHPSRELAHPASLTLSTRAIAIPLIAEEQTIGVLLATATVEMMLDDARRRLLGALAYYAALGLERRRLVTAAAYSEALRESERAKDEIFASVSHDLRTPLTTIKVLAQRGVDMGDRASSVIAEQADRLARLVNDLLDLSRLRAGVRPLAPELNTAEDLIGAALRRTEGILGGRSIDVVIDYDAPALVGCFDFMHTLRIVGNLLDNAIRHTPEGGSVEIRGDRDGPWLLISVADRGAGVDTGQRTKIFEPFYRPVGAATDGGHVGLGLSIARTLAETQGGAVDYEPREGGGSVFTLRLPAADVSDMSATEAS